VLHTGLLAWLLKDPDLSPELCQALGLPAEKPLRVCREKKVPGFKGVADLVATFGQDPGQVRYLAVETKVDSTRFAQRAQLEKTLMSSGSPGGSAGILLALGVTNLCLAQDDLGEDLVRSGWTAIGPGQWAAILERIAAVVRAPILARYLERVRAEADLHDQAIELASGVGTRDLVDSSPFADGRNIENFAWLREVRREVSQLSDDLDRTRWHPYRNQSGPLMGIFPAEWTATPPEAFIEFMCDWKKHRFLCLKLGGGVRLPMELREEAQELALERAGMSRPAGGAGANAKTCTVARLDLTEATAREAAAKTAGVFAELSEEMPELLFRFSS
jgi:hypothetical protein